MEGSQRSKQGSSRSRGKSSQGSKRGKSQESELQMAESDQGRSVQRVEQNSAQGRESVMSKRMTLAEKFMSQIGNPPPEPVKPKKLEAKVEAQAEGAAKIVSSEEMVNKTPAGPASKRSASQKSSQRAEAVADPDEAAESIGGSDKHRVAKQDQPEQQDHELLTKSQGGQSEDVQQQIDEKYAFEDLPDIECEPPVPLITIRTDKKTGKDVFKSNIKAIEYLKQIDTPIGVFSVCGQQGTGKSYLLNCILDLIGEDKRELGFKVVRQVAARIGQAPQRPEEIGTKGVWMLGNPIYVEKRKMHILVLDFQGFSFGRKDGEKEKSIHTSNRSAVANASSTDSKLFTLCTLLSSTICFNVKKDFDEKTLEDLDMFRDLSRLIKVKPSNQAAGLMKAKGTPGGRDTVQDQTYQQHLFPQLMPRLMWLVRDHKMEIKDQKGNVITENQYLENKLSQIAKSQSRAISRTRDKIIKSFPDRELVVMCNPLGREYEADPGDLQSSDEILDQEFIDSCKYLRQKLLYDTPIKQIWSRTITGPTFVFMLGEYIAALNDKGGVIHFSDKWEFYVESELQQLYEEQLEYVQKTIRNHMWANDDVIEGSKLRNQDGVSEDETLPLCRYKIMSIFDNLRTEVISRFDDLLKMANTRAERDSIGRKMEQIEKEIVLMLRPFDQKNQAESQKHLIEISERLFKDIEEGVCRRKEQLFTFSLGRQIEEYLETMQDEVDAEWKRVSDSENVKFLLEIIPNNLNYINEKLTNTLLAAEDQNQIVNDALKDSAKVEALIAIEMNKRKVMRERLYDIRDEEDKLELELDEHDKEMDALQPKLESIDEEIGRLLDEKTQADRDYNDGVALRKAKKQEEYDRIDKERADMLAIEEIKAKDAQSAERGSELNYASAATGNVQMESFTNLDSETQKIPKVTRNLPHVRQPERRNRDFKGSFQSYVERQYLPRFFTFI